MSNKDYWEIRGEKSYVYKGELFYTISPVPYYYKRRKILIEYLSKEMQFPKSVYDFGCGDGWYLNYFSKLFPDIIFSGFDISESFIRQARLVLPDVVSLYYGISDEKNQNKYDLVYSIGVFAHIPDSEILKIFNNIKTRLTSTGKLLIFEQTSGGKSKVEGETYIRRLASEYVQIANDAGLILEKRFSVDYKIHRYFERYVAKKIYKLFKGNNQTEKRINANKNILFRLLSSFACLLSIKPIKKEYKNYWGNTFFVFKKA